MKTEADLRVEMVEVGRLLWLRGLVGAGEGNVSCRLGENTLLCTPSGVSKGHLTEDDLVVIDLDGKPLGSGRPSSEIRLHLRFYRRTPHVQTVVHAHPLAATAYAVSYAPFPADALPEAVFYLGEVVTAPFGMPGCEDLPDSVEPYMERTRTFLLGNHGAVTTGETMMEAFFRMETLERAAQIGYMAHALGGAKPIPADAIASLKTLSDQYNAMILGRD